ncbi:histidine--tRNA ligase [bacterium]|nr:MAG: histidine--tRNA ligase [bacterium]
MNIKRLKGFRDVLPGETELWRRVEEEAKRVFGLYGFCEIRLPLLEETSLFSRTIGETTDIVEKEMYTFTDTGGNTVTLRPEGTASVVRAYVENGFARSAPKARWFYSGPMFRRERPQKGRFRQFHQIGAECFGWAEPGADGEVLSMLWDFAAAIGISGRVSLELNSLGCPDDRSAYVAELKKYLAKKAGCLCENCVKRAEKNPLRVIDCKSEGCREATLNAPEISGWLCKECSDHFSSVCGILDKEKIPYRVNGRMVRGLDYYNRTTFELVTGELGAQNAVAAGGRYDGLVETLGGPAVPALGFALGVERIVLMLGQDSRCADKPSVYCVHRGPEGAGAAFSFRRSLVNSGIAAGMDYEARSFKAQMRSADGSGARFVAIFGESETASGTVALKDLSTGTQETLAPEQAIQLIHNTLMVDFQERSKT